MHPISSRTGWLLGSLMIVGCTLAAYMPAMRNGFIWDDDVHITSNSTLTEPGGFSRIWLDMRANCQYYPLTFSLFYLENALWGLNPVGYHLVNVLLHACDAVLVWLILRKIGVPGSWFAAMLFALHPVEVESVAWVTEQKNTLSCLLALSSLWFYLRFRPLDRDSQSEHPGVLHWRWYGLSLALFVLALLSKSSVGTLPGVLLVLAWWKRPRLELSDLLPVVPFFVLGITLGLNTARLESDLVAVRPADFIRTPVDRLLISCRALWFYAYKLALPLNLTYVYPRWHIDPRDFRQWIPVFTLPLVIVALFLLRRRVGKGPLAAVLCYCGMLFPALGFANIYFTRFSFVSDHFQYHASIALLALFAAVVLQRSPAIRWRSPLAVVSAIPILFLLGFLTYSRCGVFRDSMTLWTDTLERNPRAWMAHANLATLLDVQGRSREALSHHVRSTELKPDDPFLYSNLGAALLRAGDIRSASTTFERGLQCPMIAPSDSAKLNNALGAARYALGDRDGAISHFRQAIVDNPLLAEAHSNLGTALASGGHSEAAITELRTALRLNPNDAQTRSFLNRLMSAGSPTGGAP
jgi:tetratricopeptide (TPR) repeat protein